MAIAARWLASYFNRPGFELFDYDVYALCGDGCMMEGLSGEAASLAGHLALGNLCWIYDNNHITIEGQTRLTFTEDVAARFLAYGWNLLRVGDANDIERVEHALDIFRKTQDRPTLIVLDSHIGYGSPHKQDTAAAHGEPLGEEEIRLSKQFYGWPEEAKFLVPDGVYEHFATGVGARGAEARRQWTDRFIFTHDAMGDGEDGPTHQPVEHLASLRAIPGLVTLRPGDANVVVEAYRYIMQLRHEPAALVLSRQPLPTLDRHTYAPASGVARGAYVLGDAPGGNPEVILIASGSEVSLAVETHEKLVAEGIRSRVVSMPSRDIFERQTQAYQDDVLPPHVTARVAVEQASTFGWERYVGRSGGMIGMKTFGASAPLKELQKRFGFEPDQVTIAAKILLGRN
jgi:transketolase